MGTVNIFQSIIDTRGIYNWHVAFFAGDGGKSVSDDQGHLGAL